jgi:hypothetical protein
MADVYVTQQPRANRHNWVPNLESAAQYGALRFIFAGDDRPYESPRLSTIKAARELAFFNWQEDFLLWPNSGDPAALLTAVLALSELLYDDAEYITLLYWNRKSLGPGKHSTTEGFYVPIKFPLNVVTSMINTRQPSKARKAS